MNVHEYQAKELLAAYGVPVPRGGAAVDPGQALEQTRAMQAAKYVVKAQIHAGGRGKGGGVKVVDSAGQVEAAAKEILGMQLITHQTGPEGKLVRKVYVEEGSDIAQELYLSVVLDRAREGLAVIASPAGGMDIEKVAAETPEKIFTTQVGFGQPLWDYQGRKLFMGCGLNMKQVRQGVAIAQALVRLAWEKEASLVEINPLAVTGEGALVALDAKMNFDDAALYRHKDVAALRDPEETDPLEREATAMGLNYVHLGGTVGTMVNGAGLAMATMDVIKFAGASPANFLDVGGGASEEMVTKGFEVILSDPNVKALLINIFGGILRCDVLAAGVVAAARTVDVKVPLVVRLEGTNVEEGRRIMQESGLDFQVARDIGHAAELISQVA